MTATEAERARIVAGIREWAKGIDVTRGNRMLAWRTLVEVSDMIEAGMGPFAAKERDHG